MPCPKSAHKRYHLFPGILSAARRMGLPPLLRHPLSLNTSGLEDFFLMRKDGATGWCLRDCVHAGRSFQEQRKVSYKSHKSPTVLPAFFLSWEKIREKTNADNWWASGSVLRNGGKHAAPRTRAQVAGGERTGSRFAPRRGLEVAGEPRPRALLIAAASCSK